ncbi:unnamed protein product [Sympodiomycopsis kandeliae]
MSSNSNMNSNSNRSLLPVDESAFVGRRGPSTSSAPSASATTPTNNNSSFTDATYGAQSTTLSTVVKWWA